MKCTLLAWQDYVIKQAFQEPKYYWKAVYFFSDFFKHSFINGRNGEEYLSYHSASIKHKLGDSTDYWVKMKLVELGLIDVECSIDHLGNVHESYCVGKESKKYKLIGEHTEQKSQGELITLEIPDRYRIKRRRQQKTRREKLATNRMRQILRRCDFDFVEATNVIDRIVEQKEADLREKLKVDEEIKTDVSRLKKSMIREGAEYLPKGWSNRGLRLSFQLIKDLRRQGLHLYMTSRKGKKKIYITDSSREAFIQSQIFQIKTSLQLQAIELSNIKEGRADINDTNFRLDTPITNCHSALLELMTMDEEKLKEIDLSNSQFVIYAAITDLSLQWIVDHWKWIRKMLTKGDQRSMSRIMRKAAENQRFSLRSKKERRIEKHIREYRTRIWKYLNHKQDTFVSLKDKKSLTINDLYELLPDLALFKNLATKGSLYEHVAENLSISRKEAKGAMFRIFFDRPFCYDFELKDRIRELLPHSIALVDFYKRDYGAYMAHKHGEGHIAALGGKTARKYASDSFAIMLQRVEADIFISGLFNDLYKQGLLVLTKHDSILCKESDYRAVCEATFEYMDEILSVGYRMATDGKCIVRSTMKPIQLRLPMRLSSNKGWDTLNHIADMIRTHFGYLCTPGDLAQLKQLGKNHTIYGLNVKMQRAMLLMKVRGERFDVGMLYDFERWLRR